jgi:hypothetical protein
MSIKAWLAGVLVALGVAGGYLANFLLSPATSEGFQGLTCAPAWVVFEQKRRCGHVDLGWETITGTVIRTKIHDDGDFSVNVVPDEQFEYLLYFEGLKNKEYVHVEFMPCERLYLDVENVLQELATRHQQGETLRVEIEGRWSFDGVDHRGDWREQLGNCLETRPPNPTLGWVEIHPAYRIRIL